MNGYVFLGLAIALEIFSTSMLKLSEGFTRFYPSLAFIIGMGASFYAFSQAMIIIPLNIAYAIWSGVGTIFTALVSVLIWKESINLYSGIGLAFIVIGVIMLNLKGSTH